jgi:hypothetical protein
MNPDPRGKLINESATLAIGNHLRSRDKEPVIVFLELFIFASLYLYSVLCAWSSREMLESLLTELTTALRLQVQYFFILLVRFAALRARLFWLVIRQSRALRCTTLNLTLPV